MYQIALNEYAQPYTITEIAWIQFGVLLPQGTGNLPKDSKAKADQIRTPDKTRLVSRIGSLPELEMARTEMAIKIHPDLP